MTLFLPCRSGLTPRFNAGRTRPDAAPAVNRSSTSIAILVAALATLHACGLSAQDPSPSAPMERLPLFDSGSITTWSTAESTVAISTERTRDAAAALHWHVTVDYSTGEPKYPIGWPRVNRNFPAGPLRDWSGWDYLHFWVYTATNREKLPAIPAGLGLHTPDRSGAFQRNLSELKAGTWVEFKLPLSPIPRHHDVRQIQFHIAESNYRDGDQLDFYVSDLALLRYAAPTILAFAAESTVLFTDTARIPVTLHVAGLVPGARAEVTCELHREGRVAARTSVAARRGVQTAALPVAPHSLAAGEYELRAQLPGQAQVATARVRLVESPWR